MLSRIKNSKNKGVIYLDAVVMVFLSVVIIYVAINVFSYFTSYHKLNYISSEIAEYASITGITSSESVQKKYEELAKEQGFDISKSNMTISFSGSEYIESDENTVGAVQYGKNITVTVTADKNLGIVGSGAKLFTMKSVSSSTSKAYWKTGASFSAS